MWKVTRSNVDHRGISSVRTLMEVGLLRYIPQFLLNIYLNLIEIEINTEIALGSYREFTVFCCRPDGSFGG
jgi:hypothetical protein